MLIEEVNRIMHRILTEEVSLLEAVRKNYFHGTASVFDRFTRPGVGKHGLGFYFTPDENEARHFAKTLYGANETERKPRVFKVELKVSRPFETMNVEHANEVASHHGLKYRAPRTAGGAKEHYNFLETQLRKAGVVSGPKDKSNFNEKIAEAGFDAIEYDLMKHLIVFNPDQIKIVGSYLLADRG